MASALNHILSDGLRAQLPSFFPTPISPPTSPPPPSSSPAVTSEVTTVTPAVTSPAITVTPAVTSQVTTVTTAATPATTAATPATPTTSTTPTPATMTRGRRKDLTIPPSRALLQQRDYRARKARYLADLEDRCQRLEHENTTLRDQVDALHAQLRTGAPPPPPAPANPDVVAASHELMHSLSSTAASLARYQQLAFGPPATTSSSSANPPVHRSPVSLATPSFTPSPVPFPSRKLPSPRPDPRLDLPRPSDPHYYAAAAAYPRALSQYTESECCGGYVDCRGLAEDDDDDDEMDGEDDGDGEDAPPAGDRSVLHRTSDVRSTASSDDGALARPARAP